MLRGSQEIAYKMFFTTRISFFDFLRHYYICTALALIIRDYMTDEPRPQLVIVLVPIVVFMT